MVHTRKRKHFKSLVATLAVGMTLAQAAPADKLLPAPQLVKGGRMLLVGYEADPAAVRAVLPAGLESLGGTVVLNMYEVPDAAQTSGLGAYSLTYLTIQVKGRDGYIVGAKEGLPGRFFTHYWNSSESMRAFTRAAGFPDDAGGVTVLQDTPEGVVAQLTVHGKPFIEVKANTTGDWGAPSSGQNNYMAAAKAPGVTLFPVPWVCSGKSTDNPIVSFSIPEGHAAARLKPRKVLWAARMNCDIVYPQGVAAR